MATFTKLIRGGADALRRMQDEMSAAKAAERVPFPDAPGALTVYHGSPHAFDQFDFEHNLLKGEGGMAFGPGGYMTGNRPLAEHYATTLSRGVWTPGQGAMPQAGPLAYRNGALQIALQKDPDAVLAWLTGKEYLKAQDHDYHLGGFKSPAGGSYVNGVYREPPSMQRATRYDMLNRDAFEQALQASGADIRGGNFSNPNKITASRIDEIIQEGRKLHQMNAPSPFLASQSMGLHPSGMKPNGYERQWTEPELANDTFSDNISFGPIVKNLRALAAADTGVAGPKLMMGMDAGHQIDLSPGWRDRLKNWTGPSTGLPDDYFTKSRETPGRNIYEAKLNSSPNDMLLYDLPFSQQSPKVQGALTQLADQYPRLRELVRRASDDPDAVTTLKGSDFAHAVPQNVEGMRALKEAGIPATAFLRAGPRSSGVGIRFDPSDYNFVIHNQDILDMLQRSSKKEGGSV